MSRTCLACTAVGEDAHRFCAECGAPLVSGATALEARIEAAAHAAANAVLSDRLRDRTLIEVELAASVAERLSTWAKVYGAVAGFLLALFIGGLALLGYQSYEQVAGRIKRVSDDVQPTLDAAKATARQVDAESKGLKAALEKQRSELAAVTVLSEEVRGLAVKVANLEDSVFESRPGVSRQTVATLQASLTDFRTYLARLGFVSTKRVTVIVGDDEHADNVIYEEHANRITIGKTFVRDLDAMYHEYTSHALVEIAGRWTIDSPDPVMAQLIEGISDYYACSYRNDPKVVLHAAEELKKRGMPIAVPLRNLQNGKTFPADLADLEPHAAGEVWGGAFWEIRGKTTPRVFDSILLAAWRQMKPSTRPGAAASQFLAALVAADQRLYGGKNVPLLRAVFTRRGLPLA